MKIEILYSELCCLYGDKGNTLFLKQCLPEAEFIETTLNAKPAGCRSNQYFDARSSSALFLLIRRGR